MNINVRHTPICVMVDRRFKENFSKKILTENDIKT